MLLNRKLLLHLTSACLGLVVCDEGIAAATPVRAAVVDAPDARRGALDAPDAPDDAPDDDEGDDALDEAAAHSAPTMR